MTVNPDRPWFKLYPDGIPHSVLDRAPKTLRSLLEKGVEQYGSETAFICGDDSVTYDGVYKNAKQLAAFMQTKLGLGKGARVAVATPNIIPFPTSAFANILAGFVQVNVNPLYTPHELEHQLNDSGAEVIIAAGPSVATFAEVAAKTFPHVF